MADRPGPDIEPRGMPDGGLALGSAPAPLLEEIRLTGSINAAQTREIRPVPFRTNQ